VRTYGLHSWTKRGVESGVSVIALRVLSLVVLVAIVAVGSLARPSLTSSRLAIVVLAGIAACGLALMVLHRGLRRLTASRLPVRAMAVVSRVMEALSAFKDRPGAMLGAASLLALYHLLGILPVFFIARGLGQNVSVADVILLGLTARFVAFLPVSFSGIGFQEGAFVGLFAQVGIDAAHALALSIMDHLVLLVLQLVGGVVYFAGWGRPREARPEGQVQQEATIRPWK